ncbi:DUF305 domain-containing protein [Aestuariivirga sp.]|uniref:DUF305 domain-containing protein n=1 Tax=Aestuariivirga sp. TaxID=2650926 RepID=UPI00391AF6B6
MSKLLTAAFSLALLAAPALAQEQEQAAEQAEAQSETMMNMMNMRAGAEMSEADRGYMKAMQTMQQSMMKMEMTGDPEGDFARMMIPHHQSAIDMADVLLAQNDIDAEIKEIAEKMKADQAKEIEQLNKWLESHPQ